MDPNVGRFRNLIKSTVVPAKRMRFDATPTQSMPSSSGQTASMDFSAKHSHAATSLYIPHLYEDLPPTHDADAHKPIHLHGSDDLTGFNTKFGLLLPNPAPDVAPADEVPKQVVGVETPGNDRHHHAEGKLHLHTIKPLICYRVNCF